MSISSNANSSHSFRGTACSRPLAAGPEMWISKQRGLASFRVRIEVTHAFCRTVFVNCRKSPQPTKNQKKLKEKIFVSFGFHQVGNAILLDALAHTVRAVSLCQQSFARGECNSQVNIGGGSRALASGARGGTVFCRSGKQAG